MSPRKFVPFPWTGHRHDWTTDGKHLNVFCSICLVDKPSPKKEAL